MSSASRRLVAVAAGVVLGWLLAFSAPRDFSVGNFVDDAHYAVLAKSLREHRAYRTINLPGAPPETKYPPGFPAVLALAWTPEQPDVANLDRLRWVNLALVGALAGALAVLLMELFQVSPPVSVAVALTGLLHPRTAALWTIPLSEPLFLVLVTSGLVFVVGKRHTLATATLVAATYVRSIALVFLIATLFVRWRRNDARWKADALIALLALAPWIIWVAANSGAIPPVLRGLYGSYGQWYLDSLGADWFTVLVRVPATNAWVALREIGGRLVGRELLPVGVVAAVGIVVLWRVWAARRVAPGLTLGLALYGLVAVMWPFPPDRFIAGIWPLLLATVAGSLGRYGIGAALIALLVAGPGYAGGDAVFFHRNRALLSDAVITEVARRVPRDAVVATTNPGLHYLSLGNHSVPTQRMRSYRAYRLGYWSTAWGLGDDLWKIVDRYHPNYIVVERRGVEGRYAVGSLMGQCPALLTEVWQSPGWEFLFAVTPNVGCTPVETKR